MTNRTEEKNVPKAVNWHCFKACNYACRFCYARFEELMGTPPMNERDGCKLLDELARQGVEKINFVGGEPMLHPHIRAWIVHAKSVGMVTGIVSNGTGIDREFLEAMSEHLDWVGLSIDASNDHLHAQLGRGRKGESSKGFPAPPSNLACCRPLHEFGVGVKLNTVVIDLNKDDDMSLVVRRSAHIDGRFSKPFESTERTKRISENWKSPTEPLRRTLSGISKPLPTSWKPRWWLRTMRPCWEPTP